MTNTLPETVEVNQAARNAFADFAKLTGALSGRERDEVLRGKWNKRREVVWFAALLETVRQQAVAEERSRIIGIADDLRENAGGSNSYRMACSHIAGRIRTPSTASSEQETPA